jgi:hypothetical protein
MSCCGGQRAALRQAAHQTYQRPVPGGRTTEPNRQQDAEFEYTGQGQLAVTGPLTGVRYHFGAHGARLLVHAPDVPSLALVPGLMPTRR